MAATAVTGIALAIYRA